MKSNT